MNNLIQSEGENRPNTYQLIETAVPVQESDGEEHPAPGVGCLDVAALSSEEAPVW